MVVGFRRRKTAGSDGSEAAKKRRGGGGRRKEENVSQRRVHCVGSYSRASWDEDLVLFAACSYPRILDAQQERWWGGGERGPTE